MVFWAKKKDYRKWYRGLYDGNKVRTENTQEVDMGLYLKKTGKSSKDIRRIEFKVKKEL